MKRAKKTTKGVHERSSAKPVLERVIQARILAWLRRKGFFCWRQNAGNIRLKGRRIHLGLPGMPDIWVLAGGHLYGLEVKNAKGKVTPKQLAMGEKIQRYGGTYAVVRSVQDAKEVLTDFYWDSLGNFSKK